MTAASVRDATVEVMRRQSMTTIFSNPGSTEISFLADLPSDLEFVLALHEGSVVGIASGWALAHESPAFVLLHTTAGLGNAVGALATARVNRAPLVVVVGQQDRRHLALQPFLAGELDGLAGRYPLETISPVRAQDVPSAVERAAHTARAGRGPVLVIVPMDDWEATHDPTATAAAQVVIGARGSTHGAAELADLVTASRRPAIVAGSGNDSEDGWARLTALAEHLEAPVWQEPFGSRAGFPQDHRLFRGTLPTERPQVREALAGHDLLVVVGAAALRQYPFTEGPIVPEGTGLVVITADRTEAARSPAQLSVVGEPADVLASVLDRLGPRRPADPDLAARPVPDIPPPPRHDEPLRAAHVFAELAALLPADTVVVEESPSSRPLLEAMVPARRPMGFLSAAMGGLGFAMPASIGIKMAQPSRPVVAVVGDGSSIYSIQSLWTAARLDVGVLFVVMANGRYAVMDGLAERAGSKPVWPAFPEVSVSDVAAGFGCRSQKISTYQNLRDVLARSTATLHEPDGPLVLEVVVAP